MPGLIAFGDTSSTRALTRTIFWDVDTQYDFMFSDGKLYVPRAEDCLPALARLTRWARRQGVRIVASIDWHSLTDPEISSTPDLHETFPPHCLAGSEGAAKVDATRPVNPFWIDAAPPDLDAVKRHPGEIIFRKQRFDVFSNPNVDAVLGVLRPDEVVLYGVALDVCDRFAVEGLLARGLPVTVVTDAVKPIYPDAGAKLLDEWARRGVKLVDSSQVTR
jgi:nicotinamidase/pyrazinamidase